MPYFLRAFDPAERAEKQLGSSAFSTDEIEVVRRLVGHTVAEVECQLICETLIRHCGNRTRAAEVLHISLRGLRNKIHAYEACGVTLPEPNHSRSHEAETAAVNSSTESS